MKINNLLASIKMIFNLIILTCFYMVGSSVLAEDMTLEYLYRYNCQQSPPPDHLLTALAVSPDRAIVAGNAGLRLIDLNALPVNGTRDYIYHLSGLSAWNLYPHNNYIFVNLHANGSGGTYGFAVVRRNGDTLEHIITIGEPGAFYEKMCIYDSTLYVAAHNDGIRIFDITNPESPVLLSGLNSGFVDAFAVEVAGDTAFVADGAGGLKIVDVTDRENPCLIGGEDLTTSLGTSEAITVDADNIYIAAGSGGLAVYQRDNINSRINIDIGGFAEDICWVGNYLAVSTYPGIVILEPDVSGIATIVAGEISSRRGSNARLRFSCGLGYASDNRLMAANWNFMDVYELKPAIQGNQADINSSEQRIWFNPAGESRSVILFNNGQANLQITNIMSTASSFTVDYDSETLEPGDSMVFEIGYDGSPSQGSGIIRIYSNDIDENPLPIQVFGNTEYLDPGEPAVNFTLPLISKDPDTGEYIEEAFTLSDYVGKIIWFSIYGSW